MVDLNVFMEIKAIVFDLDGVLVDSRNLHYMALNKALEEIDPKYVITLEEHLAKYDGLPTSKKLAMLTKEKGLPSGFHTEVWKRKQDMTIDLITECIKPCDKLIELLGTLRDRGYRLYCASNSISLTLHEMLKALGIHEFFERIYSNEDVLMSKPHPMIYMKCCYDNGFAPCQVLIVEDSPIGRVAATLSGCHVCPVPNPDAVTLERLEDFLIGAEKVNRSMKIDTRWNADVQIVIPMAGLGSRFAVEGWVEPKPLIPVGKDGEKKPMIQWVVDNFNVPGAKFVFIVRKEHLENKEWGVQEVLEKIAPGCKIVVTDSVTEGPACSVLLAEEAGVLDHKKPLMIANSDQWLEWDPNAFLYQAQSVDGCISVFHQPNKNDTKWSYAEVNSHGLVKRVEEKTVISEIATTGIYYWARAGEFVRYARDMIQKNVRVNGEFYVCPVYNEAIREGKRIKVVYCNRMWGLGVPRDLEEFHRKYLGCELKKTL